MANMIEIRGLNKYFGDLHVLKDIDLTVEEVEKVVIIGNVVYEPGKVTDTPAMQQAYQMGKNV